MKIFIAVDVRINGYFNEYKVSLEFVLFFLFLDGQMNGMDRSAEGWILFKSIEYVSLSKFSVRAKVTRPSHNLPHSNRPAGRMHMQQISCIQFSLSEIHIFENYSHNLFANSCAKTKSENEWCCYYCCWKEFVLCIWIELTVASTVNTIPHNLARS